ncbi:MAG: hypothetical protein M3Y22_00160, partial [Pseudomonadota bacterium]|nr:hypothetical protein [Pseudomonadota bacterium]
MADPLKKPHARYAALVSGLALLTGAMVLASPEAVISQSQQSGVVGRIVIQGNERIDSETITSYLP